MHIKSLHAVPTHFPMKWLPPLHRGNRVHPRNSLPHIQAIFRFSDNHGTSALGTRNVALFFADNVLDVIYVRFVGFR